jgi:hypothetical protein
MMNERRAGDNDDKEKMAVKYSSSSSIIMNSTDGLL